MKLNSRANDIKPKLLREWRQFITRSQMRVEGRLLSCTYPNIGRSSRSVRTPYNIVGIIARTGIFAGVRNALKKLREN